VKDVRSLEQLYGLRKAAEVRHFLEVHPFLVPLLKEAATIVREYFPTSEPFLEVVADPEVAGEEQLVMHIPVDQDQDKASKALDQLDEKWGFDAIEKSQDKLCITLEFR
jgi:hypothetical protein